MKTSKWNKIVACGILACIGSVIGFNYVIDPYHIFHSNYVRKGPSVNDRFNKVEHLLKTSGKYNTLIMGSSVMGAYEPKWIEDIDGSRKVYNASLMGGLPVDAQKILILLKKENVKIDHVYMGIDIFPFLQADESRSPSKQHHYLIGGESKEAFYANYFFASSVFHGWIKISDSLEKTTFIDYDIENTGRYYLLKQNEERSNNLEGYTKKRFGSKKVHNADVSQVAWVKSRFDELDSFVKWTKQNNIKTTFYIHPFHRLLRDNLQKSAMVEFRKKIFEITGEIPDFTEVNEMTNDDEMYYDPKHYVEAVAKKIVDQTYKVGL
jgi:hypothetical protein